MKEITRNNKQALEIKSIEESSGSITFYASVFGVVDTDSDVTTKDTFLESKKMFDKGEISVDLRLEHKGNWKTLGHIVEMEIDDHGLKCKAVFSTAPIGQAARRLAKREFETKGNDILFSIGYVAQKSENIILEGKNVRRLDNVLLAEVSIVEKPSNKESKALEVKSEEPKAEIKEEAIKRALLLQILNS